MSTRAQVLSIRGELGRADVLQAALVVFGDKGVRATRVEDLLVAAKVARRTFYKHFRSKEDVLAKLYAFVTRELIDRIDEAQADSADPLAGLRGALDTYLEFHVSNHRIARVLIEEATRGDSPLHPLRARFRRQLVRALDDACRELAGASLDPFVFLALVSGLEGLSLELLAGARSEQDIARARATMLGLVGAVMQAPQLLPAR